MSKISLKFTKREGKICLCAHVKGTMIRHYKTVNVLKNPNFSKWNPRAQMFVSKSETDQKNNDSLIEFILPYKKLLKEQDFKTGQELFTTYELRQKARVDKSVLKIKKEMSLGDFLENVIQELKNPQNRKPSSNYMNYQTLKSKLKQENKVIHTPISEVSRSTFVQFSEWVLNQKGIKGTGKNYISVMKFLIATINRARKAGLTTYVPDFPYMEHAPVINKLTEKASDITHGVGTVKSLSPEQYEKFLSLDLSKIKLKQVHLEYYKELFRDFCILLYELKSRPMDIMKMTWDNIYFNPSYNRWTCTYIPSKKKNYGLTREHDSNSLVIQFVSDKAMDIILKYKGQSEAGYILPFPHNNRKWNLNIPEQYREYYMLQNKAQGRINRFLWKVGECLGLPYHLTLYAFRRSAITKAIIDNNMPVTMLAKIAGTSVGMIERHYTNYLDALAAYG